MILEIDVGNSRAKWRVLSKGSRAEHRRVEQCGSTASEQFPDADVLSLPAISRVRLASVRSQDQLEPILEKIKIAWNIDVEIAHTSQQLAGVQNSYERPEDMGVDRWLAMVAAFNTAQRECLVIDCGTAMTIDFVGKSGTHEGGYILPGLLLMQQSLLSETGRVRFDSEPSKVDTALAGVNWGQSTAEAVEYGLVFSMLSTIETAYAKAIVKTPECALMLTGGDAEIFKNVLSMPVTWIPDLVLDGLAYALP